MKRNMTTLIIVLIVFACVVWLDLWWQTPRETTFYIHYQRPYEEYARSVTISGSQPIGKSTIVLFRQPDGITGGKVWFTDRNGRPLEPQPEEVLPRPSNGRMWWVTVNPMK